MTNVDHIEIETAAADWDARLRNGTCTASDRLAFAAWLAESTEHEIAYERLQSLLVLLRESSSCPDLRVLRDASRMAVKQHRRRRWSLGIGIAATVFLVMLGSVWSASTTRFAERELDTANTALQDGQFYQTKLSERSQFRLADGSDVTLDSASRLVVRLTGTRRQVTLLAGRARFSVAPDPTRPFVVTAGQRSVTALGTVFDVSLFRGRAEVTLVEGQVEVTEPGAASVILSPHQQLASELGSKPITVDVEKTLSWSEGRLYFEDERLMSAIQMMNRYSESKIVLGDPQLGELRISGMFRTGNQSGFVGALQASFPVEAHQDDQGRIMISRSIADR